MVYKTSALPISCIVALLIYVQLNDELRADLKETMVQKYQQPDQEHITRAVDKLQQDVRGFAVHIKTYKNVVS